MKSLSLSLLGLICLTASGCFSRAHMTDNYARAYRAAFTRQVASPNAGDSAKTPKGLDALESAIVVETYRTQLSPKASGGGEQNMILLSPQAGSLGYQSSSAPPPAK